MFPSTGFKQINQATQSVILSDVDITHGCNKQDTDVPNVSKKKKK